MKSLFKNPKKHTRPERKTTSFISEQYMDQAFKMTIKNPHRNENKRTFSQKLLDGKTTQSQGKHHCIKAPIGKKSDGSNDRQRKNHNPSHKQNRSLTPKNLSRKNGYSLTELMVGVAILGILSSIALPNYTRSICKSDQAEAVSELTMLQTAAMSYRDEYGITPTTWDQIGTIMPIQTTSDSGTKTKATGSLDSTHTLRSGKYELSGESNTNITTFSVRSIGGCSNYDAKACVNTQTGQSDIAKKDGNNAILTTTCS